MNRVILKNTFLLSACLILCCKTANAYKFNDKLEGKAKVEIGYGYNYYTINTNIANQQSTIGFSNEYNIQSTIMNKQHNFIFGGGYELRYTNFEKIIPYVSLSTSLNPLFHNTNEMYKIRNLYHFHFNMGMMFKITNDITIRPYGTIGFSTLKYKKTNNASVLVSEERTIEHVSNVIETIPAVYRTVMVAPEYVRTNYQMDDEGNYYPTEVTIPAEYDEVEIAPEQQISKIETTTETIPAVYENKNYTKTKTTIIPDFGCGIETLIKDKYVFGFEYNYSYKDNVFLTYKTDIHNFYFKTGILFDIWH